MNVTDTLVSTLSNVNLWAAICSTIIIIALGYILVKVKVFKGEWKGVLNSIVLKVALPCLAFTGFMTGITINQLKEQGIILGVAFGFYILLILIAWIWVKFFPKLLPKSIKQKKEYQEGKGWVFLNPYEESKGIKSVILNQDTTHRALVMWMMLIFGSVTFFGLPIIKQLYPTAAGESSAYIWNIPYRIFLYSYCLMVMAGMKFDRKNIAKSMKTALLNPIVIATFLGIILMLTQLIPGATGFGVNYTEGTKGWFEWKTTMPYIAKPLQYLGDLSSPLIWLSIGMTLAGASLLSAVKDKWVWVFTFQKLIIIPTIVFLIMLGLIAGGAITAKGIGVSMVIYAATPPATVVIAYAMQYKKCEMFASQCSALSTVGAIITTPIWIILSEVAFQAVAQ